MALVRSHWKFLGILWMLAFIVRAIVFLGYLSHDDKFWQVDSRTYDLVARGLTAGKGVSFPDGTSNFYRLPGYPFFLSIFYSMFGEGNKTAALWGQIILASFIPLLIFLLSLMLLSGRVLLAKIVSLISVFHLGLVLYSGFFMSESLFIFFLCAAFFFFFRAHKMVIAQEKVKIAQDLVRAGFFLGIVSLIRPVGHYLIVLMCVMLLLFLRERFSLRIRNTVIFFIGWFIPVFFWLLRNYLLLGYVFFHTLPGGHFLHLSAARIAMYVHDVSYQEARTMLQKEVDTNIYDQEKLIGKPLNEIEQCYAHEVVAKKYFKMRPLLAVKNWGTDILRASLSLYSAEIMYLESERQEYDYFKKGRSFKSLFSRYFYPETGTKWVKMLVWGEIAFFIFMLLTFLGYCMQQLISLSRGGFTSENVFFVESVIFILFFLVIALAGGYARMRLPIELLLWIWAMKFWVRGSKL